MAEFVPRRSLRPLKVDEIHSPVEIKKREVFDELIQRRWGTPMTPPKTQQPKAFENMKIMNNKNNQHLKLKTLLTLLASSSTSNLAYDQIINAEVQLQLGEEMVNGKAIQRTIGPDGQVTGTYDNNPFLNSIIYDVEFPDGQVKEFAAMSIPLALAYSATSTGCDSFISANFIQDSDLSFHLMSSSQPLVVFLRWRLPFLV